MNQLWQSLCAVVFAAACFIPVLATALPGDPDLSFGTGGVTTTNVSASGNDVPYALAIQTDGKIVLAGGANIGGAGDFAVVRYQADGTLDPTFHGTGIVTTDFRGYSDQALSVKLQGDSKILVAGSSYSGSRNDIALARYNPDGSLDTSFGPNGDGKLITAGIGTSSAASSVALQPDGKIVIAGQAGFNYNNKLDFAVVRYLSNGTLDSTFGTGGLVTTSLRTDQDLNEFATSLVLQSDGKIVVAGAGAVYNGNVPYFVAVVRYNPDGTLDSTFHGPGGAGNGAGQSGTHNGYATGVALQPDGRIVLAGSNFGEARRYFTLDRYTTVGDRDLSVYTGIGIANDAAFALAMQADGRMVLGGYAYNGDTARNDFALVRYNPDGNPDATFHNNGRVTTAIGSGDAYIFGLGTQPDGKIVGAGESLKGSRKVFTVARYQAFGKLVTDLPANGTLTTNPMPSISGSADPNATVNVYFDSVSVGTVAAGSDGAWSFTPPAAVKDGVHAVKAVDAGDISGTFSNTNSFTIDTVAPGAPVVQTPTEGALVNSTRPYVSGTAESAAIVTVYLDGAIAGKATAAGTGAWSFVPATALLDGPHTVKATATDQAGNTSAFSNPTTFSSSKTIAGTPGDLDAAFGLSGKVLTSIGTGNDIPYALAIQTDGKIVLAGSTNSGGAGDFAVVRYQADGTLDPTFHGTGIVTTDFRGYSDQALSVKLQGDSKILVAGSSYSGSRNDIALARYNPDGSLDTSFGPNGDGKLITSGIGTSSGASSVALQPDGKIVIAGQAGFNYNNKLDFAVARYLPNGTLDSTFGTGGLVTTSLRTDHDLDEFATSLGLQSDGKIVVAGAGAVYNGNVSYFVAVVRYNPDGTLDSTFHGPGGAGNGAGQSGTHNGYATGVALQPDGRIVLAGSNFGEARRYFTLDRYTTVGDRELSVYTGIGIANDAAFAMALQPDGRIVLGGYAYNANTARNDFALVRYGANGSVDTGFQTTGKVTTAIGAGDSYVYSIAIQPDGRILAAGESYNGTKKVFTLARYYGTEQPPIVQTGGATGIVRTGAVLAGSVNPNSLATTAHFEYGLGTTYGSNSSEQPCGNGSSAANFSGTIGGLTENTTYHYRLVATNSVGSTYGADATFITAPNPPLAFTGDATGISSTGATLAGVVIPNARVTTAYFEYGLTTKYDQRTADQSIPADGTVVNIFAALTELIPGASYHYRVVAINGGSPIPIGGEDKSFIANNPPPTVATGAAAPLTTTSAQVSGSVRAHNSDAQVFFEYGIDGVNFPESISANPAVVSGDEETQVAAALPHLDQGVTYYYRVRAASAGGMGTGDPIAFRLNLLSGLTQVLPGTPPGAQGFLLVNLTPAGIGAAWRFVGEQQWRPAGVPLGGLTSGSRQVEYRPVAGYLQPLREPVTIVSGGAATVVNREYFPTGSTPTSGLSLTLLPSGLGGTGWRLLGDDAAPWKNSGETLAGLFPGVYLVEFQGVTGYTTPPPLSVTIGDGETKAPSAIYFLADAPVGAQPEVVGFDAVTADGPDPYTFVGQLRSDSGAGSGFVVRKRVVATAAHVVFDDAALSAVTGLQWLFQRDRGTYEPVPQEPRGSYVLSGYAAQRTVDGTPGISSAAAQNLDVGAVWFYEEDAGRGGFGGYLASDGLDNEWLLSPRLKTIVGYPLDGISAANQGRMHATAAINVAFAHASGRVYLTTDITSRGGNSGGPVCVRFDDGKYYPAAIYLGGTTQTRVRAIDSDVITLFDSAEESGNTGQNSTNGGVPQLNRRVAAPASGSLRVTLEDAGARAAGAGWRIGSGAFHSSGELLGFLSPGNYTVSFQAAPGYQTPASRVISVTPGDGTALSVAYPAIVPASISGPSRARTARGVSSTIYHPLVTGTAPVTVGLTIGSGETLATLGLSFDAQTGVLGGTPKKTGTYSVTFTARNAAGTSDPLGVLLEIVEPGTLSVAVTSGGTVSPASAVGTTLRTPDALYTLQAKPDPGYLFAGWTGTGASGVPSADARLTFLMPQMAELTASFIPNPFPALAGKYQGLLRGSGQALTEYGMINAQLGPQGGLSGKILIGDLTYTLQGALDPQQNYRRTLKMRGLHDVAVDLHLDTANESLTGTATLDGDSLRVAALRTPVFGPGRVCPQAGKYTLAWPHGAGSGVPEGDGYGAVTVTAAGAISCKGALGDGTPINRSGTLGTDGQWPLYWPLSGNRGLLTGDLKIHLPADIAAIDGTLDWLKPADHAAFYPGAFFTRLTVKASRLGGSPFTDLGSVTLTTSGGGVGTGPFSLSFTANGAASGDGLSLVINPASGLFSGSFLDGGGHSRHLNGAFLPATGEGFGLYKGDGQQTGAVEFGR